MSDLQILTLFRLAQAANIITKLTKTSHTCNTNCCKHCVARSACRAIVEAIPDKEFDYNYRKWAKRTPLLSLPSLQQQHPELLI